MEYSNYEKHGAPLVNGFILQAPISDREGLKRDFPNFDELLATSEKLIAEGKDKEYIPASMVPADFSVPITAYRMHSLLSKG